jgi:hypothetical protein
MPDMRRAARFTDADLARAIKAALKAKLQIACVRIEPEGTILLISGDPDRVAISMLNPWDE